MAGTWAPPTRQGHLEPIQTHHKKAPQHEAFVILVVDLLMHRLGLPGKLPFIAEDGICSRDMYATDFLTWSDFYDLMHWYDHAIDQLPTPEALGNSPGWSLFASQNRRQEGALWSLSGRLSRVRATLYDQIYEFPFRRAILLLNRRGKN